MALSLVHYALRLTVPGLQVILPLPRFRSGWVHGAWFRLGHPNVERTLIVQCAYSLRLTIITAIPYPVPRECLRGRDPPR